MNEEIECKTHPDAPHGFVRNASHTEDRYVCECEYWEEPKVNERILELARRVWPDPNTSHVNHEKFAELIVRECVNIVDKVYDEQTGMAAKMCRRATPYQEIINELEEHFGVEE